MFDPNIFLEIFKVYYMIFDWAQFFLVIVYVYFLFKKKFIIDEWFKSMINIHKRIFLIISIVSFIFLLNNIFILGLMSKYNLDEDYSKTAVIINIISMSIWTLSTFSTDRNSHKYLSKIENDD